MQHLCSEMLIFQRVLKSTSKTHRYLSSKTLSGISHRYLHRISTISLIGISPPSLSSVSLICITHRYLSPVSLIGISHHVTHLNYVWRICCQVNHFGDKVITITHFLLKVRTWSICKNYLIHAISSFQKMQHLCSEMPIFLSAPRECSGRRQKPNAFYNFWWEVNFALLKKKLALCSRMLIFWATRKIRGRS